MLNLLRQKFAFGEVKQQVVIDETLTYDQKLVDFAKSDIVIQRLVCVREFVEGCFSSGFYISSTILLPLIRILATDSDTQVRSECFDQLSELAGYLLQADYDVGYSLMCDVLIPCALNGLSHDPQAMNRQDAGLALVRLCSHMRSEDKFDRIVSPVISRLFASSEESQRMLLVELLGLLSCAIGEPLTSNELVPVLVQHSKDASSIVRGAVVMSIGEISNISLLDTFFSLCNDSDPIVRHACLKVFPTLLNSASIDILCPIFIESFLTDISVSKLATSQIGHVLAAAPHFPALVELYVSAVHSPQSDIFKLAEPFPKIVEKVDDLTLFSTVFSCFQTFSNPRVRLSVTLAIPILYVRHVGWDLFTPVLALLSDENLAVSTAMHKNILELIEFFSKNQIETVLKWFHKTLLLDSKWRRRLLVANVLGPLIDSLRVSQDEIFFRHVFWKRILPIYIHLVSDKSCVEVSKSALESTRSVLNSFDPNSVRLGQFCTCINQFFGFSEESIDRQIYIQIAGNFANSRNISEFFSSKFIPRSIQLSHDSSVTVRSTWAIEIPPLLRAAGGKWSGNLPLVLAAHAMLTDPDAEVVRLVSRVTFTPMDEMSVPSTPEISPLELKKFSSFQQWLEEVNGPNSP